MSRTGAEMCWRGRAASPSVHIPSTTRHDTTRHENTKVGDCKSVLIIAMSQKVVRADDGLNIGRNFSQDGQRLMLCSGQILWQRIHSVKPSDIPIAFSEP